MFGEFDLLGKDVSHYWLWVIHEPGAKKAVVFMTDLPLEEALEVGSSIVLDG